MVLNQEDQELKSLGRRRNGDAVPEQEMLIGLQAKRAEFEEASCFQAHRGLTCTWKLFGNSLAFLKYFFQPLRRMYACNAALFLDGRDSRPKPLDGQDPLHQEDRSKKVRGLAVQTENPERDSTIKGRKKMSFKTWAPILGCIAAFGLFAGSAPAQSDAAKRFAALQGQQQTTKSPGTIPRLNHVRVHFHLRKRF